MSARSCSLITRAGTGYLLSSHESLLAATVCVVGAQGTLITERCLPTSATTGPMHELRGTLWWSPAKCGGSILQDHLCCRNLPARVLSCMKHRALPTKCRQVCTPLEGPCWTKCLPASRDCVWPNSGQATMWSEDMAKQWIWYDMIRGHGQTVDKLPYVIRGYGQTVDKLPCDQRIWPNSGYDM